MCKQMCEVSSFNVCGCLCVCVCAYAALMQVKKKRKFKFKWGSASGILNIHNFMVVQAETTRSLAPINEKRSLPSIFRYLDTLS